MRSSGWLMCILCIVILVIWNKPDAVSHASEAESSSQFIYTKHARERMEQRGADEEEVEETLLMGEVVSVRDGKSKYERTYQKPCMFEGRRFPKKKLEVVAAKDEDDWVIVTVIADCKK